MTNLPLSPDMVPTSGVELCQVYCNGQIFEGWTEISIVRSMQEGSCRFRLSVTEASGGDAKMLRWQIRPLDPIRIRLGGVQAVNGYVDVRQAAYDAESHGVEIEGRSLTADAIDSSAVKGDGGPAGPFAAYKLDEIARSLLQPFGIGLKVIGDIGASFPMVSVQFGESPFEVIERLARLRGFIPHDDADGDLVLEKLDPNKQSSAGLVEGVNIKRASAVFDLSQYASDLFVVGSTTGNDEASGSEVAGQSAKATNSSVPLPRPRPKVVVLEQPGDKEDMKVRADREVAQIAAETAKATIVVYGWQKADGTLWTPGDIVHVKSPMLLLDRDMGVAQVMFTQSDGSGTETELQLVVPEALTPDAPVEEPDPPTTEDGTEPEPGDEPTEEAVSAEAWTIRPTGAAA